MRPRPLANSSCALTLVDGDCVCDAASAAVVVAKDELRHIFYHIKDFLSYFKFDASKKFVYRFSNSTHPILFYHISSSTQTFFIIFQNFMNNISSSMHPKISLSYLLKIYHTSNVFIIFQRMKYTVL